VPDLACFATEAEEPTGPVFVPKQAELAVLDQMFGYFAD
jgi:hypothetical protein